MSRNMTIHQKRIKTQSMNKVDIMKRVSKATEIRNGSGSSKRKKECELH